MQKQAKCTVQFMPTKFKAAIKCQKNPSQDEFWDKNQCVFLDNIN